MNEECCMVFVRDTFFREDCECWLDNFHYTTQLNTKELSFMKITDLLIYRKNMQALYLAD